MLNTTRLRFNEYALIRRTLPLQPLHRLRVLLEELPRLLQHLRMIRIDPLLLPRRQQLHVHELPTHRRHGHVLEPEIRLLPEPMARRGFLDHDHVLDTNAECAVLVVSRFVGDDVADCEWDFAVLDTGADADGS